MKLIVENSRSLNRTKIVALEEIIKSSLGLDDVLSLLKKYDVTFKNYQFGRGGNHVWIARKRDHQRVAMIQEE